MRLQDIPLRPMPEMCYGEKKADLVITGLEKPINDHLLKLVAVTAHEVQGEDERAPWREELVNWLDEVAEIRTQADRPPRRARIYFSILFDEPFGRAEVANMARRLRRLQGQHYRVLSGADPAALAGRMRRVHHTFSEACARGAMSDLEIEALVDRFARGEPVDAA